MGFSRIRGDGDGAGARLYRGSLGTAEGGRAAAVERPSEATPINPDALPVDIRRIQKALSRPPAIRPESVRPVFRVQVFSRSPTIDDILGPDWRQGPTPLGAMTHQEFLDLVTPTDVKGYAAFDNKQAADRRGHLVRAAVGRHESDEEAGRGDHGAPERERRARKWQEALAALKKARLEAGLPDK